MSSDSGIRSIPTFLYGLALLNAGFAIFLTEAVGLELTATMSIAFLFTGVGGLIGVAADALARSRQPGPEQTSDQPHHD